jgi:hypothetical protein
MHVAGRGSLDAAHGDTPLTVTAERGGRTIGQMVLGTTDGVDAAKIVLDEGANLQSPLPLAGIRAVSNDVGISVSAYGAASGRVLRGAVQYVNVNLIDGGESLVNAILASINTTNGDSGAGLVDNSNLLLGILFGRAPAELPDDLRVFSPAIVVASRLRFSVPSKGEMP